MTTLDISFKTYEELPKEITYLAFNNDFWFSEEQKQRYKNSCLLNYGIINISSSLKYREQVSLKFIDDVSKNKFILKHL